MTLSELRDALAKVCDEVEGDPDVYIEHEDESYTQIAGIEVEDGGDINIY